MDCFLGIDIGTFETKGVLADGEGAFWRLLSGGTT